MLFCADKAVFQHFRISGTDVLIVQCSQELCIQQYACGRCEDSYFIFQTVEVDACFSTDSGIHHGQQSGRDIDVRNASFKGGGSKSSKIGYHSTA